MRTTVNKDMSKNRQSSDAQYSLYQLPHSRAGTCSITTREEQ